VNEDAVLWEASHEVTSGSYRPHEPKGTTMATAILGRKLGMTQVWSDDDRLIPVTVIEAGPCVVSQVRTVKRDGYRAVQLAFGDVKESRVNKPEAGHFAKAGVTPKRFVAEVPMAEDETFKLGQEVTVAGFEPGQHVHVTGTSKGKGFQGGMKRHGFRGGPKTHGQSDRQRAPGSRSSTTTPGRVYKGSRGPGHMGSVRVTSQNLRVELVDPERNLLGVNGSVPGPKGAVVVVKQARKQ